MSDSFLELLDELDSDGDTSDNHNSEHVLTNHLDKIRQELQIKHNALEQRHRDMALHLTTVRSMAVKSKAELRLKTQKLLDLEKTMSSSEDRMRCLEMKG